MTNAVNDLFSPLQLRGITLPNRIAVSPMCEYSSVDGLANDWHLVHLGSRAIGGAGLVMTEAAAVSPEGRITPGDLGIWNDAQIAPLQRITDFLHQHGSYAGIQLAHAGRKASMAVPWEPARPLTEAEGGWANVLGPSAIAYSDNYPLPREATHHEIQRLVRAFADAAQRALDAGFDVVELHAAHGYLLHEFLSPRSNQRTDEYGGNFENRCRFLLETVRAVRAVWPQNLPLLVRISATDWAEGDAPAWDVDQSIALAALLRSEDVDLIDVSSGGNLHSAKVAVGPGYQVPFASRIRHESGMTVSAVGLITEPEQADAIIREGEADMVFLARELLRDPYWPLHAAHALGRTVSWPVQYERAAAGKVPHRAPVQKP